MRRPPSALSAGSGVGWAHVVGAVLILVSATVAPAYGGTFAGANARLACSREAPATSGQIFTMEPDGSAVTFVTSGLRNDAPAWSPDGTKIAYEAFSGSNFDIWVMNADGSDKRRVTTDPSNDRFPAWSPDGSKIVYSGQRESEILVIDAAGGGPPLNLTQNGPVLVDTRPSWSPDGTKIAFDSNRDDGRYQVFVMNPDGSDVTQLTTSVTASSGGNFGPKWSPDGARIVYSKIADPGARYSVYRMNADGSEQRRLTHGILDFYPTWSPDGALIAYSSLYRPQFDVNTVSSSDGTDLRRITNDPLVNEFCDWGRTPGPVVCLPDARVISGLVQGPLDLTAGSYCLYRAAVTGPVTVGQGALLSVLSSQLRQGLTADGAKGVQVCRSQVQAGGITARGVVGRLEIGSPPAGACGPNAITGAVVLDANAAFPIVVAGNAIGGLSCVANPQGVTNGGSANLVRGGRTGQCASL